MRKRAWVLVECDSEGCGNGSLAELKQLGTGAWHDSPGIEMLEDAGWQFEDVGDFCPKCADRNQVGHDLMICSEADRLLADHHEKLKRKAREALRLFRAIDRSKER